MASRIKRANLDQLPLEIWDEIISHVDDERSLESLSLVSKSFLSLTNLHRQTLKITTRTALFLSSFFRRFKNIKHLSFSEYFLDPLSILRQVAEFIPHLETLVLGIHYGGFLEEKFNELPASVLSGIKSFKMCYDHVYDLSRFVKFFPSLEDLFLTKQKKSDRWMTLRYIRPCKNNGELKSVYLSDHDWVTDDIVISLCKTCPNLEEFVIKDCSLTQLGISSVLHGCAKLKTIRLKGILGSVNSIGLVRSLSVIEFSSMEVSNDLLTSMAKANLPLKKVTLDRCKGFTFDGMIPFFDTYNDLDYLSLEEVHLLVDDSIASLLKCFKKLRHVKLNRCNNLSYSTLFNLINECPLLERIEMEDVCLRNKIEELIANDVVNYRIKTLNLSSNSFNLSTLFFRKIASACPNLESLKLSRCKIEEGIDVIMSKCLNLRHLDIDGCSRIRRLGLESKKTYKLESLVASRSGLSCSGLDDICNYCSDLMFLDLSYCESLEASSVIKVIKKCIKLKEINLDRCEGVDARLIKWMVINRQSSLRKIIYRLKNLEVSDLRWRKHYYAEKGFYILSYL